MMPRIDRNAGPNGTANLKTSVSTQTTSAAHAPAMSTSRIKVRNTGLRWKSNSTRHHCLGS